MSIRRSSASPPTTSRQRRCSAACRAEPIACTPACRCAETASSWSRLHDARHLRGARRGDDPVVHRRRASRWARPARTRCRVPARCWSSSVEGSVSNVIGLPMHVVVQLAARIGVDAARICRAGLGSEPACPNVGQNATVAPLASMIRAVNGTGSMNTEAANSSGNDARRRAVGSRSTAARSGATCNSAPSIDRGMLAST